MIVNLAWSERGRNELNEISLFSSHLGPHVLSVISNPYHIKTNTSQMNTLASLFSDVTPRLDSIFSMEESDSKVS